MLVGGVVDVISQCKSTTTDERVIGYAVAKLLFFSPVTGLGFWLGLIVFGVGLAGAGSLASE